MPRLDGIDVSHHQDDKGPIDWAVVRAIPTFWAATKATQGLGYNDPTCEAHRAQMGAQDFTHKGLYHWLSPNVDPRAQARHFLDCVGTLHPGEFAMLDAEEGGITAADVLEWCETVEAVTRRPCAVYTGAYVAGGTIWQSTAIRTSTYGARPMHIAAYTTEAKMLKLPGVKAYPQDAWQYSSNGPVPGVVGRCDMNRIDNIPAYDLAAGVKPDLPPPDFQPVPEDDMALIITNDAEHDGHAALAQAWLMMDDGTKRELDVVEKAVRGNTLSERVGNAQLDLIPDWVPNIDDPASLARLAKVEAVSIALNDSVGRLGQVIGDMQKGLGEAAEARA